MSKSKRGIEEIARLAEVIRLRVQVATDVRDYQKFVAINVDHEIWEVDTDDLTAITRLRERDPTGDIFLARVGFPTACRFGAGSLRFSDEPTRPRTAPRFDPNQ